MCYFAKKGLAVIWGTREHWDRFGGGSTDFGSPRAAVFLFYLLLHCLSTQKAYFLHYLESGKAKVEANEVEMQRLREETLRNREIARQSKTR